MFIEINRRKKGLIVLQTIVCVCMFKSFLFTGAAAAWKAITICYRFSSSCSSWFLFILQKQRLHKDDNDFSKQQKKNINKGKSSARRWRETKLHRFAFCVYLLPSPSSSKNILKEKSFFFLLLFDDDFEHQEENEWVSKQATQKTWKAHGERKV